MSNIIFLLILLINSISPSNNSNSCDFVSSIDIQSATYTHALILRIQTLNSSEDMERDLVTENVLVREVIKTSKASNPPPVRIDDVISIRIDQDLDESCWYLLRIENLDLILFLNQTNTREYYLHYPPIEFTFRVRQNIDAVIHSETYAPQVIIKTRITKPILAQNYSLLCNARGNPIPRLRWSKNNEKSEYYPSTQQCQIASRIFSVQHKYQSILYFQSLIPADSGVYICHAENAINHTMTSISIDIDQMNVTCADLQFCHHRGQCIDIDNHWKCLCDNHYYGEQCEISSSELIKQQNDALLLIKSRFLAGCILVLIGFILILIVLVSCLLARKKSKSKGKEMRVTRCKLNGTIQQSSSPPTAHPLIIDSSEQESGSIQLETYRTSSGKYSPSPKRLFSV